jgi:hypothetical protein
MPSNRPPGATPEQRSLRAILREFLTPAVWKQAQQCRQRNRRSDSARWKTQPLVLVLLFMTWAGGDSQDERFELAKGYCQLCLAKRRGPGKTVSGFHQALERLPLAVLRTLAAAVRRTLVARLAAGWSVHGWVPIGCDGSRLECPRSAELEARLGRAGKAKAAPTLWVTALVHLRWGVPWAWRFGKGTASERAHLEQLLDLLPAAALLVADAGYFGFELTRRLVDEPVHFLLRMSSNVTLYTAAKVRLDRYREGVVYYWPGEKDAAAGVEPLRLRLIRIRARKRKHDVWLLTNVLDAGRLPHALAGQMYRWRWQNEGCFRTYKQTLRKVKLASRTVALVHREAEGSWLALQLLLAQGVWAQRDRIGEYRLPGPAASARSAPAAAVLYSPRQILVAIRRELRGGRRGGRGSYEADLRAARGEVRERTSAKASRVWPRRKPHKPPKPPRLRELSEDQKRLLPRLTSEDG